MFDDLKPKFSMMRVGLLFCKEHSFIGDPQRKSKALNAEIHLDKTKG